MKNKKKIGGVLAAAMILIICAYVFLASSGKNDHPYADTYHAVDPPVESGETVIETLVFEGDQVTMISGDIRQTVGYEIEDDLFTIKTDFGDFSYSIEENENGLIIDGILYEAET